MRCPNCDKEIKDNAARCPYCNYLIDKRFRITLDPGDRVKNISDHVLVSGSNFKNLMTVVLGKSCSKKWEEAVQEWEIYDCIEDMSCRSRCVCGKENIRYLFTIRNLLNNSLIFPIGSSCINKFNRDELSQEAGVREGMFKLLKAIRDNEYITLNKQYFSRKLLKSLYERGAFIPNKYNNFDGYSDYTFMLDMFNKRKTPSEAQQRKIRAIIVASIKPYLEKKLAEKIY